MAQIQFPNEWSHQMFHKRQHGVQHARNRRDAISKRKDPAQQRKDRKRLNRKRNRKETVQSMAFDFDDFLSENKVAVPTMEERYYDVMHLECPHRFNMSSSDSDVRSDDDDDVCHIDHYVYDSEYLNTSEYLAHLGIPEYDLYDEDAYYHDSYFSSYSRDYSVASSLDSDDIARLKRYALHLLKMKRIEQLQPPLGRVQGKRPLIKFKESELSRKLICGLFHFAALKWSHIVAGAKHETYPMMGSFADILPLIVKYASTFATYRTRAGHKFEFVRHRYTGYFAEQLEFIRCCHPELELGKMPRPNTNETDVQFAESMNLRIGHTALLIDKDKKKRERRERFRKKKQGRAQ